MSSRRAFGFGIAITILFCEIAGLWILLATGVTGRLVPADPERFHRLGVETSLAATSNTGFIHSLLPDTVRTVESVLRWTMNQAVAVGDPGPVTSAREIYEIAARDKGLLCGQMALLFLTALRARNHPAREVSLVRSLLSEGDTHTTVEVREKGRWMIYDPTFHTTFERDGEAVGAAAIHEALLQGAAGSIEPVFHGPVAYPARLESYYMDWLPLFNNVLVFDDGHDSLLAVIPPFRYWLGPRWFYLSARGEPTLWHVAAARWLYLGVVVVLPLALLILTIGLGGSLRRRKGGSSG